MDMLMQKIPPHSVEAEQAVIGACLLAPDAIAYALENVRPEDFYQENHRLIFQALVNLSNEGKPRDMVTLVNELKQNGQLERIGGVSYIATLADAVPSTSAASYYAKIVAEKSLVRQLIAAADEIVAEGYQGSKEVPELLALAEQAIFSAANRKLGKGFARIKDVALATFEEIGKLKAADGVTGVPTFRDLDKLLSGLQKGDLVILAARPGMGKTSFAMNIAQKAATKHDKTVAVFSLEMPNEQLAQRMLCTEARVDQGKVRKGLASAEEIDRLSQALIPLSDAKLFLDDTPGITVTEVRAKARRLMLEEGNLDLIVIDYLQLMQGGKKAENRQQEISDISRSLKALAKELNVPILALSQLSRLVERSNEPPNLSHLRESGALEQDADCVIFIHRPKTGEEEADIANIVEIRVEKHRNGPVGMVNMAFLKEYTLFMDLAKNMGTNG